MKRFGLILAASAVIAVSMAGAALAQDSAGPSHKSFGAGFHSIEAPLGFRWWLGEQKLAFDFGLGFTSTPAGIDPNEREKSYAFEVGVPIVCHSWERAHALIRPGLLHQTQQIGIDADPGTPGLQYDTENQTQLDVMLEGEAEVFLADNVSVSAAHGIAVSRFDPGFGGDTQTVWGTRGNNFTTIGFHVYMFR
jgi:hypothetical protein